MVGRMMIAGGGNSVKDVSFAVIVFLISIFWPIAFCLCGTPHRHASLQQSLRRDQICSILTAKFKSKKSHYFCLLVVVLVAVVGEVALSQDILETSLSHHAHVHENLCKLLPLQLYVLCFKDLYICMKERREKIHKIASPS